MYLYRLFLLKEINAAWKWPRPFSHLNYIPLYVYDICLTKKSIIHLSFIQGVTCIWANRGVSEEILEEAFRAYANNHKNQVSVGVPNGINNNNSSNGTNTSSSTLSLNSEDSDESQTETTVIYVHRRRGSRASITYDVPPTIDRAIRLRGRRMSAPALSIPQSLQDKKLISCPEIVEN